MSKQKYEVMRSYTVVNIYHVEAESPEEAQLKVCRDEGTFIESHDSDYHDAMEVSLVEEAE